jgi:hypothetical protein
VTILSSEGVEYWQSMDMKDASLDPYIRYLGVLQPGELEGGEEPDDDGLPSEAGGVYRFIVCMSPWSSWSLLRAQYLQCDIAFRRAVGYHEFEIGGWDPDSRISKCMPVRL